MEELLRYSLRLSYTATKKININIRTNNNPVLTLQFQLCLSLLGFRNGISNSEESSWDK
jgi:hypothetical protein